LKTQDLDKYIKIPSPALSNDPKQKDSPQRSSSDNKKIFASPYLESTGAPTIPDKDFPIPSNKPSIITNISQTGTGNPSIPNQLSVYNDSSLTPLPQDKVSKICAMLDRCAPKPLENVSQTFSINSNNYGQAEKLQTEKIFDLQTLVEDLKKELKAESQLKEAYEMKLISEKEKSIGMRETIKNLETDFKNLEADFRD
jgi:hypothetical protein